MRLLITCWSHLTWKNFCPAHDTTTHRVVFIVIAMRRINLLRILLLSQRDCWYHGVDVFVGWNRVVSAFHHSRCSVLSSGALFDVVDHRGVFAGVLWPRLSGYPSHASTAWQDKKKDSRSEKALSWRSEIKNSSSTVSAGGAKLLTEISHDSQVIKNKPQERWCWESSQAAVCSNSLLVLPGRQNFSLSFFCLLIPSNQSPASIAMRWSRSADTDSHTVDMEINLKQKNPSRFPNWRSIN